MPPFITCEYYSVNPAMESRNCGNMSEYHLSKYPLCGHDCGHEANLREHIMVGHRKSAVVNKLISILQDN